MEDPKEDRTVYTTSAVAAADLMQLLAAVGFTQVSVRDPATGDVVRITIKVPLLIPYPGCKN